jgi:hypothetical protein
VFGLLAALVAALLGLAGVGLTWIRDAFGDLRAELSSGFGAVNTRLDATNARIDRIDGRIDGLTAEVHGGFAAVRSDIAGLDRRLAAVEGSR